MQKLTHHEALHSRDDVDSHASTPLHGRSTLSLLRRVERVTELDSALQHAMRQAALLRQQLPGGRLTRLEHLSHAVGIEIRPHADMPFPGIALKGYGRWQIYVSDSLPPSERLRAAAHELKFVLDHGVASPLSDEDHENVAACFAAALLTNRSG